MIFAFFAQAGSLADSKWPILNLVFKNSVHGLSKKSKRPFQFQLHFLMLFLRLRKLLHFVQDLISALCFVSYQSLKVCLCTHAVTFSCHTKWLGMADRMLYNEKHLAMLQTNLDTLLFCPKLLCRKLL
jgi:hypothetical protein